MPLLLSLTGAIIFGCADFLGGLATRRNRDAISVVVVTQVAGLLALLVYAPLVGATHVTMPDLAWGALAGLSGATGLVFFYEALARGTMSVVSPVTAVVSAIVPLVAGVTLGNRPSVAVWTGLLLGIAAICLFGFTHDGLDAAALRALAPAVVGGLGFGFFFVLLSRTQGGAGLWPLVAARGLSGIVMAVAALATSGSIAIEPAARWIALGAAVGDVTANALYLLSTRHGDLAVVGVVIALYPASTLVLARIVLHERLNRVQQGALALAAFAVVIIALA
jgi:drug/metabolite transporter (DMT)-like permease